MSVIKPFDWLEAAKWWRQYKVDQIYYPRGQRFQIKSMWQYWLIICNWLKMWERTAEPFGFELSWALLSLGEIESRTASRWSRKAKLRAVNSNIEIALHSRYIFLHPFLWWENVHTFWCTLFLVKSWQMFEKAACTKIAVTALVTVLVTVYIASSLKNQFHSCRTLLNSSPILDVYDNDMYIGIQEILYCYKYKSLITPLNYNMHVKINIGECHLGNFKNNKKQNNK